MKNSFSEVKLFQVKPDRWEDFERLIDTLTDAQRSQPGCQDLKYMKRFFILDGLGNPPRELTKIVKCVKYYSYWEFDNKNNYGKAIEWFFAHHEKELQKLLIMPFDIHCGYSLY